jgi:predicted DNA-binding antitoxin AbrB/MazE fold protein
MSRQIQAVYEKGVLRPLEPLKLDEGEELDVVLLPRKKSIQRDAARVLADIACLQVESEHDGFSGAEHDSVLYPEMSDDLR